MRGAAPRFRDALTFDLDIVHERTGENVARLLTALADLRQTLDESLKG